MRWDNQNSVASIFGDTAFKGAVSTLVLFIVLGLLAPLLCNDRPILAKMNDGSWIFPWTKVSASQDFQSGTIYLDPPISFNNTTIDKKGINWKPPLFKKSVDHESAHYLGTSKLGKDVLAGMVYGSKIAMSIGFLAIGLAFIIGVSLGMMAGFGRDSYWKGNIPQIILSLIIAFLIAYYILNIILYKEWFAIFLLFLLAIMLYFGLRFLGRLPLKKWELPIDTIVIKLIEIRKSIPLIYLLLAATAIIYKQGIISMALLIGCVVWVPFARHSRASTMALLEEGYIQSAKALGLGDVQIIMKHIFKGILPQVLVVAAFAMSGAIVLEATLSFLGMGLPLEQLSWGSMLAEAKQNPSAWWMAVFPGIGIFLTVLSCNIIGEFLSHRK